jgi:phage shock protein PspC (stress-responsive transcriptional regulator)
MGECSPSYGVHPGRTQGRIGAVTEFSSPPPRTLDLERRRTPHLKKELLVTSTLARPQHGKVIAGVCAGLAERFGWSPFAVRLAFLLSCLLPGPQFVAYIVLWMIMPKRPY